LSVRTADASLGLDGGGHRPLDTTHVDTVRFPPGWAGPVVHAAIADGELDLPAAMAREQGAPR
jgi:hypothetical protein